MVLNHVYQLLSYTKKSNLLKVLNRRKISIMKYAHKLLLNCSNLNDHDVRSLRSNRKLLLKQSLAKKSKYENSFIFKAIKLWNNLSEEIKQLRMMYNFNTRLKREVLLEKITSLNDLFSSWWTDEMYNNFEPFLGAFSHISRVA